MRIERMRVQFSMLLSIRSTKQTSAKKTSEAFCNRSIDGMCAKFHAVVPTPKIRERDCKPDSRYHKHVTPHPDRRAEGYSPSSAHQGGEFSRNPVNPSFVGSETIMHYGSGNLLLVQRQLMMKNSPRNCGGGLDR